MKLIFTLVLVVVLSALGMYGYLSWNHRQASQPAASAEAAATVAIIDPLQKALDLAAARGCNACHSTDGSKSIGPSWMGSYGATRTFKDGTVMVVDDNYLRESMLEPAARVVLGYENVMIPAALSEDEVTALIDLIRNLTARMPQ